MSTLRTGIFKAISRLSEGKRASPPKRNLSLIPLGAGDNTFATVTFLCRAICTYSYFFRMYCGARRRFLF